MNRHAKTLLMLALLTAPSPLSAQQSSWPLTQTPEDCARAATTVRSQTLVSERRATMLFLSRCGPSGGVALAGELRRSSTVSDTTALYPEFHEIARIRDAEILRAALELAGDRSATPESRIMAFKVLISYHDEHRTAQPFSSFFPDQPGALMMQMYGGRPEGAPLPDGWLTSAVDVVRGIASSTEETDLMRVAARRTLPLLR